MLCEEDKTMFSYLTMQCRTCDESVRVRLCPVQLSHGQLQGLWFDPKLGFLSSSGFWVLPPS